MPRGKQKGFKKDRIVIQDNSIMPFYIIDEDRQYVVMKEGSTIPYGYYTGLGIALQCISKELNRSTNTQKTFSLGEYIKRYDELSTKILTAIQL